MDIVFARDSLPIFKSEDEDPKKMSKDLMMLVFFWLDVKIKNRVKL